MKATDKAMAKTATRDIRIAVATATAFLTLGAGLQALPGARAAETVPPEPRSFVLAQAAPSEEAPAGLPETAVAPEAASDRPDGDAEASGLALPPDLAQTQAGGALGEVPAMALSDRDRSDLARASAYLNRIETLKGEFTQFSDSGGMAEGEVWLKKPGRMRFEYNPPVEMTFVSDGTWIAVDDREFEVVNRYPLDSTPLSLLLTENVDLAEDAKITSIERLPGQLRITAREDEGLAQGELTMIFADPGFELRQWIIEDAQGTRTTVALRNVQEGVEVSNRLFVIEEYEEEW